MCIIDAKVLCIQCNALSFNNCHNNFSAFIQRDLQFNCMVVYQVSHSGMLLESCSETNFMNYIYYANEIKKRIQPNFK